MGQRELRRRVGGNLKAVREHQGLPRRAAAASIGITPEYLAKIERGEVNMSLRVVERIAAGLGVEALGLTDDQLFEKSAEFAVILREATPTKGPTGTRRSTGRSEVAAD